jgi:outer membrane immunogenic protein
MKKFLLGSVGLAAMLVGPAMAADMPVAPAAPPPIPYYDWSGAYIGGNVGGVWYDLGRTFPLAPNAGAINHTNSDSDGIFGFHAGAQWQWGAWVLGVEAALSGCFQECRAFSGPLPTPPFINTASENKMTNLFTVGPRLGYAWDRWMIFATGGWASASLKGTYCSTLTGLCDGAGVLSGASRNSEGWYAGGGFDYMVHKGSLVDVILGVEYQHFDVGSSPAVSGTANFGFQNGFDLDAKGDLVRARLTIKTQGYGWWGPSPGPTY